MKVGIAFCAIAVLTAGCTLFDRQEKRIAYTESLDPGGQTLVTDAKQRVIINTDANVGSDPDKNDHVIKNHPNRIICSEPSPDVAQAISAALQAAAQVDVQQTAAPAAGATVGATQQASGSGSIGSAYVSSIAQLGERLATVQLLRDKMYRACEAYQNGAISDTSYTLMLSRFDKTMSSMLAAEVAAGAFGRNLAALGGSASAGGGVDPDELEKARDAVKTAAEQLRTAGNVEDAAERETEMNKAKEALDDAVTDLAELEFKSAAAAARSGPMGSGNSPIGQISSRSLLNANAITQINTNYLDDDATGTLIDACVVALDRSRSTGVTPELLQEHRVAQEKYSKLTSDLAKAEQQQQRTAIAQSREQALIELNEVAKKFPTTLVDACYSMLTNASTDIGILKVMQDHKLKLRSAENSTITKYFESLPVLANNCKAVSENLTNQAERPDFYIKCMQAMPGGQVP